MKNIKKYKKIIFIVLGVIVVIALIIGGIFLYDKVTTEKREEEFKTAAKLYYDSYMSGITGSDEHVVSLETLEKVKKEKDEQYEIDSLKKCDPTSTITYTLSDGKIVNEVMDLKCN